MKSINFEEATNKIAENQPQFNTVISQWQPEDQSVNLCFELEDHEIEEIIRTKKIWYKQQIGRGQMHPMMLSPYKDHIVKPQPDIKSLNDIDTRTREGKFLIASLSKMTATDPMEEVPKKVEDLIREINEVKNKIYPS